MVLFSKRLNSMVAAVFGLALCAHGAQAPRHVNINRLSTTVEDVVVPLPNEIFGALNKLSAVNWKEHVRSDEEPNFTERPRIALLLGTVIADGFIAVQAEDAPAVKDIGQRVLRMRSWRSDRISGSMWIENGVICKGASIVDLTR